MSDVYGNDRYKLCIRRKSLNNMECLMKDFISEIKKIPTDGLIYCLSEKSIDMFRKNECLMPVTIPVIHNGQRKILTVTLTA